MTERPILPFEDDPNGTGRTQRASAGSRGDGGPLVADAGRALPAEVLLDRKPPRIEGPESLRGSRADARTRLLPDAIESFRLGATGYLRKPVSFVEFPTRGQ